MVFFKLVYCSSHKVTTRTFAGWRRKNASMFSLQISDPTSRSFSTPRPRFFKRWLCRPTSCSVMCQHSHRALKQASGRYKEADDLLLFSRATRNDSSSKTSPRKCRMMQGFHLLPRKRSWSTGVPSSNQAPSAQNRFRLT